MHLIVGLGNPGRRYAKTRHNAGFLVIDRLAERWGGSLTQKKFKAEIGPARIGSQPVVLCKPQTFMNLSGEAVVSLRGYYKVDTSAVVVIHDEVDLPFGDIRVKSGGGHRGHNGLRDISKRIGPDYRRIRFGVGRPPEGWDTADYVLGTWTRQEAGQLDAIVDQAADTLENLLRDPSSLR